MPCDVKTLQQQEKLLREQALAALDAEIAAGRKSLVVGRDGRVHIVGWSGTLAAGAGWHESCAVARLFREGSWLTRTKMQQQGVTAGAVAKTHSH